MKQFIIKTPQGEDLTSLSEGAQKAIHDAKGQFPSGVLVGSEPLNGYELRLVMCNLDLVGFQSAITALGLVWEVVASEGVTIVQSGILPYMMSVPSFDIDGNLIGSVPVTDLTGKLQTYSGKTWIY